MHVVWQPRRVGVHGAARAPRAHAADIKVKEPNFEAMMRGRREYEPPRFMTVAQAIDQLLEVERARGENGARSRAVLRLA